MIVSTTQELIMALEWFAYGAVATGTVALAGWFMYQIATDSIKRMVEEEVRDRMKNHKEIYHDD